MRTATLRPLPGLNLDDEPCAADGGRALVRGDGTIAVYTRRCLRDAHDEHTKHSWSAWEDTGETIEEGR